MVRRPWRRPGPHLTRLATGTGAATEEHLHGHPVAHGHAPPPGGHRPQLLHDAHDLVAGDEGPTRVHRPGELLVVRPAQPARLDPEDAVVGPHLRALDGGRHQVPRRLEDQRRGRLSHRVCQAPRHGQDDASPCPTRSRTDGVEPSKRSSRPPRSWACWASPSTATRPTTWSCASRSTSSSPMTARSTQGGVITAMLARARGRGVVEPRLRQGPAGVDGGLVGAVRGRRRRQTACATAERCAAATS